MQLRAPHSAVENPLADQTDNRRLSGAPVCRRERLKAELILKNPRTAMMNVYNLVEYDGFTSLIKVQTRY